MYEAFAIQTIDGGRTTGVILSDATQIQARELFLFNCR